MGKRGPAPKGKSAVLNTRVTPELQEALRTLAKKKRRTLSAEIEHGLRFYFNAAVREPDATQLGGIFRLMRAIIETQSPPHAQLTRNAPPLWLRDARAFDQVLGGINAALEQFRPPEGEQPVAAAPREDQGTDPHGWDEAFAVGRQTSGIAGASQVLSRVKDAPPGLPLPRPGKKFDEAPLIKEALGPLAERISIEKTERALTEASTEARSEHRARRQRTRQRRSEDHPESAAQPSAKKGR